jgi:hypothetical protein
MEVRGSFTLRMLYPRKQNSDNRWIGGRVGPRAGLDPLVMRKTSALPGIKLRTLVQLPDRATPVPKCRFVVGVL